MNDHGTPEPEEGETYVIIDDHSDQFQATVTEITEDSVTYRYNTLRGGRASRTVPREDFRRWLETGDASRNAYDEVQG